jgi:hypothetical protein
MAQSVGPEFKPQYCKKNNKKNSHKNKTSGVVGVVEHWRSKHEALSSNSSAANTIKQKKIRAFNMIIFLAK